MAKVFDIAFSNKGLSIKTDSQVVEIYSLQHMLENKSRNLFFRQIHERLLNLVSDVQKESKESYMCNHVLSLILLTKELLKTGTPVRCLEYNCTKGLFSQYLASWLGFFHEQSILDCAALGSYLDWFERIYKAKNTCSVNYHLSLIGDFGLQAERYHIACINGDRSLLNPDKVLQDCIHSLRDDGVLICQSHRSPLLESCLQIYFDKVEEYRFNHNTAVFIARKQDLNWDLPPLPQEEISKAKVVVAQAEAWLHSGTDTKQGRELEQQLNQIIDVAVRLEERELKHRWILLKEQLIKKLLFSAT